MPQLSLTSCLKLFNRKERYWLLRNALGDENLNLPLGKPFLEKVLEVLPITPPSTTDEIWWGMDYHFDWLAGALKVYGQQGFGGIAPRKSSVNGEVISGTQEDVDFIISFGNHLILIEAKGVTSWNSKQFKSKLNRVETLKKLIVEYRCPDIFIHFILISPKVPKRLPCSAQRILLDIPCESKDVTNFLGSGYRFLKTTRCDEQENDCKNDEFWKISPTYKNISE